MPTPQAHALPSTRKDIVIVGAGPSGLSLACALANSGLEVALVDQQAEAEIARPAMDGRDIAMTHLSQALLQRMRVWQRFAPAHIHPLHEATVQNGNSVYALHFERGDKDDAPLGYLVANHRIREALYAQANTLPNVTCYFESSVRAVDSNTQEATVTLANGMQIHAALVVAADSRFSATRRMMGIGARMRDYGRVMIVCNMAHTGDHRHTAQECFRYGRTCAILPLGSGESSIVITVPASRASALAALPPERFAQEVERMLDHRLGRMTLISERFSYPLVGAYANRLIGRRFALIGDAAVGMHPVTAHGYNLALRSVDTLARQITLAVKASRDIGSPWVLHPYEIRHQLTARPLYDATNLIVRVYTDDKPIAKLARSAALRIGNSLPPFKHWVTHGLTHTP